MKEISIGYLPLTDAATLIAAADFGFAEKEGLRLNLQRDVSWANLRDKLVVGHIDAAHMLGPLAIATSLGLGQLRRELRAIFVLNANGNAITVAAPLARDMAAVAPAALNDAEASAKALGAVVRARRAAGKPGLTFASVFPFSMHTYLLRRFFAMGGMNPDSDVEIVVVPPPYMVDCIDKGLIDGFCVGNPWNSVAVDSGRGVILAAGSEIVPSAVEKVLALPANSPFLADETAAHLLRALDRAAQFVADPANVESLARAMGERMDVAPDIMARSLSGDIVLDAAGRRRALPPFIRFAGRTLNRPDPEAAAALHAEMRAAGQIPAGPDSEAAARLVFAPHFHDRAFA